MAIRFLVTLLLHVILLSAQLLPITIGPVNNHLVDSAGRVRFFHGTNAVEKSWPWYPTNMLSQARMNYLQEMGFNALRLGTMWPGVEPIRGIWNNTYLNEIGILVNDLEARGIYTLLDCHQDVYNERLCGEGFPDWSVNTNGKLIMPFAQPIHEEQTIDPSSGIPENCSAHAWASYYLSDAVGKSFQGLYDNYDGLQDEFALFWKKVAQYFAQKNSVIGYELINEPWCGDIFSQPELLLPEFADLLNLGPMYDVLSAAIRQVDKEHLIFYEPVTWVVTPTGFSHVPGGDEYKNKSVLSWHYYCWIFDPNNMSNVEWVACHDVEGPDMFYQRKIDMERLGGASFLTEWGANCDGQTENGIVECNWVMDEAETYLQSWTYWAIEEIFDGDNLKLPTAKLLGRTYPQAIAGIPVKFDYDPKNYAFSLVFKIDTTITLPTEIYLNQQLNYPNGFQISIVPAEALKVQTGKNMIYLFCNEGVTQNTEISVSITAK